MAITSIGYGGTVNENNWALLGDRLGGTGATTAGFEVTTGGSGDRALTVQTGEAFGDGIRDFNDATINLNVPLVVSGVRWDTIVLRRDWQGTGGSTSISIVQGGPTQAITVVNNTPGVICDYPLSLVQVTAGSTAITAIYNQRVETQKVLISPTSSRSNIVKPDAPVGTILSAPSSNPNNPAILTTKREDGTWREVGDREWTKITTASGIISNLWYRTVAGVVYLQGSVQKTTGIWNGQDVILATLPTSLRPDHYFRFAVGTAGGGAVNTTGEINTTGQFRAYNTPAGSNVVFVQVFYNPDF